MNFDPLVLVVRINLEKYIPHPGTFIYHLTSQVAKTYKAIYIFTNNLVFLYFFHNYKNFPFITSPPPTNIFYMLPSPIYNNTTTKSISSK